MYFLNGFSFGFCTGLTCFLVQCWPEDREGEFTKEQNMARSTGWTLGIVAGLSVTIPLAIWAAQRLTP